MIRFLCDFLWKNKLVKAYQAKKAALFKTFDDMGRELVLRLDEKKKELDKQYQEELKEHIANLEKVAKDRRDLEDLETRVLDRKKELERVNEELKVQIRLIEAKSSPDQVWASAFGQGYSKAWDSIRPLMDQGIDKIKETIRNEEIEASIPRIDHVVSQRLTDLGELDLLEIHKVDEKRREFILKREKAVALDEKQKYSNYLHVLDWMLGKRNGN